MFKEKLVYFLSLIMIAVLAAGILPVSAAQAAGQDAQANAPASLDNGQAPDNNGIPVLYLTIDPEEFSKVNESEDHSYRANTGTIRIEVPDGYKGTGADDALESTEELQLDYIRGRGHGTWAADKKPYKLKLQDKTDLLGMGKNKNWALLANRYDDTLIRNRIIAYIGEHLGLSYTPQSQPVDLVVNGNYYGTYLLSEDVRIDGSRVDIDELSEEDIQEPEITGGYLLCMCPSYDDPMENIFITDHLVRFGSEEPQFNEGETGLEVQKEYIVSYMQNLENAIYSPDFCDENGIRYSDMMDIRSAADYWWVQEFSGNTDAYITNSTYLYKERNGKLYWGPLWDFDLSLGNGFDKLEDLDHCNMSWIEHLRAYDPAE